MEKTHTPICKIAATAGGALLTGVAIWLNAEHVADAEGWASPLVFAGVTVTLCAAFAPPFAERAAKSGQPLKSGLLWAFFALAVAFSLSASIARSSDHVEGKSASVEGAKLAAANAKQKHADLVQQRDAECATGIGNNCRDLRDQVTKAWEDYEVLAKAAPIKAANPGFARVASVLRVDEKAVALYVPLFLPLGLELGGFIFLAFGLAPARRRKVAAATVETPSQPTAKPSAIVAKLMQEAAKPAASGTKAYYVARLQREFPAVAKRVAAGELSVYRACIEAGLRKEPKKRKWDANAYAVIAAD